VLNDSSTQSTGGEMKTKKLKMYRRRFEQLLGQNGYSKKLTVLWQKQIDAINRRLWPGIHAEM